MKICFPFEAPQAREGPCTWHSPPRKPEAPRAPAEPAPAEGCYGPDGPTRPPAAPGIKPGDARAEHRGQFAHGTGVFARQLKGLHV